MPRHIPFAGQVDRGYEPGLPGRLFGGFPPGLPSRQNQAAARGGPVRAEPNSFWRAAGLIPTSIVLSTQRSELMRLVLCDDNRIFCEALAVALEARGHQALAIATTADEIIAAVTRHQPDACLLDLRFHDGGDGLGAARAIRDQCPDTAVLVRSGLSDRPASLAARQIGVAGAFSQEPEICSAAAAL